MLGHDEDLGVEDFGGRGLVEVSTKVVSSYLGGGGLPASRCSVADGGVVDQQSVGGPRRGQGSPSDHVTSRGW